MIHGQADLFAQDYAERNRLSEPERSKIMSRLKAILAELEAATTFPWPDPLEAVHLENRFERDCQLIGEEGAGLWARFDKVMDRLHLLQSVSADSPPTKLI
jgi:hypothetical protein